MGKFIVSIFRLLTHPMVLSFIGVVIAVIVIREILYRNTSYYKVTHNSLFSVDRDLGKYGEYLIYKRLRSFEKTGCKFLYNLYLPNEDETTEVDVLMISPQGIFVFESKNYSGWIFGTDRQIFWTQSLPRGKGSKKERFYNPILQNETHLKALQGVVGDSIPLQSMIVFSERCELKNVKISSHIPVIKRDEIVRTVRDCYKKMGYLAPEEIAQTYEKLYPYTQVSDEVKKHHIDAISEKSVKKDSTVAVSSTESIGDSTADKNETSSQDPHIPVKCPKCGGNLVLHTAKKGESSGKEFYGCSNFPRCRYIYNISEKNAEIRRK